LEVAQNLGNFRIRLVCRLKPGNSGVDPLFDALRSNGWNVDGLKLLKGGYEAEVLSSSLRGDEIIFSLKFTDSQTLDNFIRSAIQECWYIDVYYHLRAESAKRAAETLGIELNNRGIFRIEEADVSLKVESFPNARALTISYRVGWREINRNAVTKIHEKLLETRSGKSLLGKIIGWMK